ncbi:regulatory LuxR family protein [Motilibacter rhizosphaerae]|uniref:Regulatory LuxR family protein n=1 Tax=Motilibacter rhizosphaerae TaxID=598652 RepID=A0A4Q7NQ89_9ACTN|nr:helix-turn-helix transcriptional regulator [Motilibacter rhizosphaerae]RZS87282.1 regulatory LuxR family protein [Motilibacter rhizosphaerae]
MAAPGQGELVGRAADLARVEELLGVPAPAGRGVLLAGDAGVGKTRLADELRARAGDAGWRVLVGHCLDFGGDSLPHLPFAEIVGAAADDVPGAVAAVQEQHPALVALLPGDSGGRAPSRPELVDAVWALLRRLGAERPVLLVVEDAHWADASTRGLLGHLLARLPGSPVSVLVTYRAEDLHRRHPLRADVPTWARLAGVSRTALAPLGSEDVRRLVQALRTGLPDGVVERIVERAEGNAFFTEELVAAAGSGERALSADLADLLLLRLDALSAPARTLLRTLAVGGRETSHALLEVVAELPDGELDAAAREAVDAHVLTAGADTYAFRHALLAEAVYDDLLPGERVRWHRRYAAALAGATRPGSAAELARHASAAHDTATALPASVRAGDEAAGVGGFAEALLHYEHALELLAEGGDADPAGEQLDLVVRAAAAAVSAGELHRGVVLLRDLLARLPEDADPARRTLVVVELAAALLLVDGVADPVELTSTALERAPDDLPGELRARLLALHARGWLGRGRQEDAADWALRAVELATELELPAVLVDARTTLARLQFATAGGEAEAGLLTSTAAARAAGDVGTELRGGFSLGTLHYEQGRLAQAQQDLSTITARAVEAHQPWAPYAISSRVLAALVAYVRGEWEEAGRLVSLEGEQAPPLPQAVLAAAGLYLLAGRGDDGSAAGRLSELRRWWDHDSLLALNCTAAGIDLLGDRGELEAAAALHGDGVRVLRAAWADEHPGALVRLSALLLGQYATAGVALTPAAALVADAELAVAAATRTGPEARAWLARVHAEHLRLQHATGGPVSADELVAAWEEAASRSAEFGHVFETARSQARLAAVLRATGRGGAEQAAAAEAVAARLGAAPLLREVAALGFRSAPSAELLTAREREVLELVAQGLSNREVGQRLFISAKTVSVHLSNVMAKLGAASRTEAVFRAQRAGLLAPG